MVKYIRIEWPESQEWLEKVDNERVFAGQDNDVFVDETLLEDTNSNPDLRDIIIGLLKDFEKEGGIDLEELYKEIPLKSHEEHYSRKQIDNAVIKLLEEGVAFEPRPQTIRYLG